MKTALKKQTKKNWNMSAWRLNPERPKKSVHNVRDKGKDDFLNKVFISDEI